MKRAEQRDRKRTAYHEAGHAVIAAIYGFPPYRATIARDEGQNKRGEVRIKLTGITYHLPNRLTAWMLYSLAGIAAQDRFSRKSDAESRGGDGDVVGFYEDWWKLHVMTDGQCAEYEDFRWASKELVNRYWYAINSMAFMLLERETIEYEDLSQALSAAIYTADYAYTNIPNHLYGVAEWTFIERDVSADALAASRQFESPEETAGL